jgi:hypothetical protein
VERRSSMQKMVPENADPQLRAQMKVSHKRMSMDPIRHGFYSWLGICTGIDRKIYVEEEFDWLRSSSRKKALIS